MRWQLTHGHKPDLHVNRRIAAIACLAAAWSITIFYFLPNTSYTKCSFLYYCDFAYVGLHTSLEWVLSGIVTVVSTYILFQRSESKPGKIFFLGVVGYFSLYFVDYLSSGENPGVQQSCGYVLAPFCCALVVAVLAGNATKLYLTLYLLSIPAAAIALYMFAHHEGVMISGTVARAGGTFSDPSALSFLLSAVLPIPVWYLTRSKNAVVAGAHALAFACILAATVLTWSRAGIIAGLVSIAVQCKRPLGTKFAGLLVLLLAAVAMFCLWHRSVGVINGISASRSNQSRLTLAQEGLNLFTRCWLTGVGPGRIQINIVKVVNGVSTNTTFQQPKNTVIFMLDQIGVTALAGLVIAGGCLVKLYKRYKDMYPPPIFAVCSSIAVFSMFDTPFGCVGRAYGTFLVTLVAVIVLITSDKYKLSEELTRVKDSNPGYAPKNMDNHIASTIALSAECMAQVVAEKLDGL